MTTKFRLDGRYLVISLRLCKPRISRTGKTLLVGTTHGVRKTKIKIKGKAVRIVANAFIPADHDAKPSGDEDS